MAIKDRWAGNMLDAIDRACLDAAIIETDSRHVTNSVLLIESVS